MIISTKYGDLRGFEKDGCNVFLGILFAAPPVGALAFKHPLPPNPWEGLREASSGSCNPIQAKGGFYIGNNSLDCLYLNVFSPKEVSGPLPVMVWIYGGAYSQGGTGAKAHGSSEVQYDLARFAAETNCVVVTFNYRLNLYGFLDLHSLDSGFERNNGLFDQIMALKFVKENIEAFGGDPDNITVFGQSAGGACILALMSMKEAEGLFHKAIVQSACIEHFFTEAESELHTKAYLRYAGVRTPEELMNLSEAKIRKANQKYSSWLMRRGDIRCAFSPVIDGRTLPEAPKEAVKRSNIPLLIGNTSQEGNLFLHSFPSFVLPPAAKYLHINVDAGKGSYKQRMSDALTHHIYIRPQNEILESYAGKAWRYVFDHITPGNTIGCFHASELPVLFGETMMGIDGREDETGVTMRNIWARFAKCGDPGWEERTVFTIR